MTPLDLVRERCRLALDGWPQPSQYTYEQRANDIPTLLTIFLHNIAHQTPYISWEAICEEVERCYDRPCANGPGGTRRWLGIDLVTLIRNEPIICRFVLQYNLAVALGTQVIDTRRTNTYRLQCNLRLLLTVPAEHQDMLPTTWYSEYLDQGFDIGFELILRDRGAVTAYNLLKVWWLNDPRLLFLRDTLVPLLAAHAAECFALQVLIDDGYLIAPSANASPRSFSFFAIMARLPQELQARIAFATTGLARLGDMSIDKGFFPRSMIDKAIMRVV